jgi:hypothetical protein
MIDKFPFEKVTLPTPDLKNLKGDIHAFNAFKLPEDPNELEEQIKGHGISADNILWWRQLTENEKALVQGNAPWQLDDRNRPIPIGEVYPG